MGATALTEETLDICIRLVIPRKYINEGVDDTFIALDVVKNIGNMVPPGIQVHLAEVSDGLMIDMPEEAIHEQVHDQQGRDDDDDSDDRQV